MICNAVTLSANFYFFLFIFKFSVFYTHLW